MREERWLRRANEPGRVFGWSETLAEKPGFIECTKDGAPLYSASAAPGPNVQIPYPDDGMPYADELQEHLEALPNKGAIVAYLKERFGITLDENLKRDDLVAEGVHLADFVRGHVAQNTLLSPDAPATAITLPDGEMVRPGERAA